MKKQGFTLLEVVIAIVVVSAMAAAAVIGFEKAMSQARAREAVVQLRQIQSLIKVYQIKHGENVLPDTTNCASHDSPPFCTEEWINATFGANLAGEQGAMHLAFANKPPFTVDETKYIIRAHWPYGDNPLSGWAIQMTTAYPDPCCCVDACMYFGSECPIPLPHCNGYGL